MTTDTKPSTSPPAPAAPASAPAARLDPLPTEMRLRALEARVRGVPATTLEETPRPPEEDGVTLTHRVASLRGKLDQVAETSPPIKQFLENYDRYAPLLRTLPETDDDTATAIAADVLPAAAKTTLVLESRADIIAAEKGLREIDVYNKRGVAGAEGLDEIVALKPALVAGTRRVAARHKDMEATRADVAKLVGRYNEFTSTVSEMFLALHDQLTYLEEAVTRAERAKRDELKQRY